MGHKLLYSTLERGWQSVLLAHRTYMKYPGIEECVSEQRRVVFHQFIDLFGLGSIGVKLVTDVSDNSLPGLEFARLVAHVADRQLPAQNLVHDVLYVSGAHTTEVSKVMAALNDFAPQSTPAFARWAKI